MMTNEARLATAFENGTISGVALVEIESAQHIAPPIADAHPWQAKARLDEVLWGNGPFPDSIEFERGHGSSACEVSPAPLPRTGDRWVIYFWRDGEGRLQPWWMLDVSDARRDDLRWSSYERNRVF